MFANTQIYIFVLTSWAHKSNKDNLIKELNRNNLKKNRTSNRAEK